MKVLITGGTSGIGRATALRLGGDGHDVDVVGGMNEAKGKLLQGDFASLPGSLRFFPVNLSRVEEIKEFSRFLLAEDTPLDILFLNAGTYVRKPDVDRAGLDAGFVVNYLHRFMLLVLLNPLLRQGNGRVIINGASRFARTLELRSDVFSKRYSPFSGMMQATYALGYLTYWTNRTFRSEVPVQAVDPGYVNTETMKRANPFMRLMNSLFAISPEQAAAKIVPVIEDERLRTADGVGFDGKGMKGFSKSIRRNPKAFLTLWKLSLEVSGLQAPDWAQPSPDAP